MKLQFFLKLSHLVHLIFNTLLNIRFLPLKSQSFVSEKNTQYLDLVTYFLNLTFAYMFVTLDSRFQFLSFIDSNTSLILATQVITEFERFIKHFEIYHIGL